MQYTATAFYADGSPVQEPGAYKTHPEGKATRPYERHAHTEARAFLSGRSAWAPTATVPDLAPEEGCTIRINGELAYRFQLVASRDPETGKAVGRLDWVDVRGAAAEAKQADLDARAAALLGEAEAPKKRRGGAE